MTVCERRRSKRWYPTSRIALLSLGLLLILSEVCSLSSAHKIAGSGSRWYPARKVRFSGHHARPESPSELMSDVKRDINGSSYEDEKRLVHTGPNPLHN